MKWQDKFEKWYPHYPKKRARGRAEMAFKKINPSPELLEKMIQAVELQKQSVDWLKDGGQFIPHPASWLNAKMWEDGVDVVRQPEINRANIIDEKNRAKQREDHTAWIQDCEPRKLYECVTGQLRHLAWLAKEIRPELMPQFKEWYKEDNA
jgi:hypothetical protein